MSRPYKQYSISGVSAVLAYLAVSPTSPKPLSILVDLLRHALRAVGLDTSQYSFQFGAATAAAGAGIQDLFIQNLGHWKSSVFTSYIRATLQLFQPSSQICQLDSNYVISTKSLK